MSKKNNKGNQDFHVSERVAKLDQQFLADMELMILENQKEALRLIRIMRDVLNNPFKGLGKPEPLKYEEGWSRRVNHINRLQYSVENDCIKFSRTLGHYTGN